VSNAYKYRPPYTQNEVGPDGGTGESSSPAVAPAVLETDPERPENNSMISQISLDKRITKA
jgi:hypothetical protein